MSQPSLVFKIFFQKEIRRFHLPATVSFYEFLTTLEQAIFRDNLDYHRELYLQYNDSDNECITVSSSIEWYEALKHLSSQPIKKFHIVEGSGVYFKDSPPPEPLFFALKYQRIAGVYTIKIQLDPIGENFGPYPDLRISLDGIVRQGQSEKIKGCIYCVDSNVLSWNLSNNNSLGELKFDLQGTHPSFTGTLRALNDDPVQVIGTWKESASFEEYSLDQLDHIKHSVPGFLGKLFPGGKILPFHIPPWLEAAINVSRGIDEKGGPTDDVYLRVEIPSLFEALHEQAISKIPSDLKLASKYLHYAIELKPQSSYAHYNLACVRALQCRANEAFPLLRKAIECGYSNWEHLVTDEDLISLHEDSRFFELLPEKLD